MSFQIQTLTEDYTISIHEITILDIIKTYKNCRIYKGLWRYQLICVKEITDCNDDITNELLVLSKCIHPKIVQFLGVDVVDNKTSLVFEYMDNGSIRDYIQSHSLSTTEKIKIMMDIAIGLNYLHNREPQIIVHRDLKPDNILVNKHGEAKIADFGISKLVENAKCDEPTGHTGETGTYIWMSPEVLKHEPYNYKSDIYSFGLLMYYIWTENYPFSEYEKNTIQLMYSKFNDDLEIGKTNFTLLDNLINECCDITPESRPNCVEIIQKLKEIV